jgi:hypothetical protein
MSELDRSSWRQMQVEATDVKCFVTPAPRIELWASFFEVHYLLTRNTFSWGHDAQRNDTQHNDTQHNKTQHNNTLCNVTQHNDTQHNDTQRNDKQHNRTQHNDTQHNDTRHYIRNATLRMTKSQHKYKNTSLRITQFDTEFCCCDGHYFQCRYAECRFFPNVAIKT